MSERSTFPDAPLQGSMVALVTPMHDDGSVDDEALGALIDWHVAEGTSAIVSVGTTGESATLDHNEHCEVMQRTIEYVDGRVPVIAGTGANSTREAIELTAAAAELGAAACLLVVPYYNKPTQEGMFQHFSAVANAVDVPQLLYNVPGRTVADLLPPTVARLAVLPNIIGIKEATGEIERTRQIVNDCGDDFVVLSGDDPSLLACMRAGGRGVISVTANVAPGMMAGLCDAALTGDDKEADWLDQALQPLHAAMFVESNPIPVKWALKEMGRIGDGIRLPLTPLAEEHHGAVRAALQDAGVLS